MSERMSRVGKTSLSLGYCVGLAFWVGFGCNPEAKTPIPTYRVKPDVLTRLVSAEGNLEAAVSTPISPPPSPSFRGLKLAWIAADGSPVKKAMWWFV